MNKATEKLMYECTIEGFINDFNTSQFSNDVDTINNAIAYILKYGMHNDYTKCDIKELIFNARNEVAKSVARKQLQKDPKDLANMQSGNAEDNEEVRQFLADPLKYMAGKIKDEFYVDMIHYDDPRMDPKEKEQHRIDYFISAKRLAFDFTSENFINAYREYEKNAKKNQLFVTALSAKLAINDSTNEKKRHVKDVLENSQKACNMDSTATCDDIVRHNKGGIFENLFNTTSKEYKEFVKAYKEFNDENSLKYGNDAELDKAARAYIRHKIPGFQLPNELPKKEDIERFSGTSRGRLEFCLGVLQSIKQRFERNLMATAIDGDLENDNKVNQNEFQSIVNKDINKDEIINNNNDLVESNEIQVENEAQSTNN